MTFLPDLFINRTAEGLTGLGVAIFGDGRVEGLTRPQYEGWQILGAKAHEVTVGGHWSFLLGAADRVRASYDRPAPTISDAQIAQIAAEINDANGALSVDAIAKSVRSELAGALAE